MTSRKPSAARDSSDTHAAVAAQYARRLAAAALRRRLGRASSYFAALTAWASENGLSPEEPGEGPGKRPSSVPKLADWRRLDAGLAAGLPRGAGNGASAPSFRSLVEALALDPQEEALLRVVEAYVANPLFESLVDGIATGVFRRHPHMHADPALLGLLAGVPAQEVGLRLARGSRLMQSGVLRIDEFGRVQVASRIVRVLRSTDGDAVRALFGGPVAAQLGLSAFDHMQPGIDRLRALVSGALDAREGVNLLFVGPTGAGKTSLAATLGAALDCPVLSVGKADDQGNEPSSAERIGDLALAHRLIGGRRRAILLFDEVEDIVGGSSPEHGGMAAASPERSRAFLHQLLERAQLPVIFTANDERGLGQPFLRRCAAILRFQVPPASVRRKLVAEAAQAEGLVVEPARLDALARLPAGPAIARSALRAGRLAGSPEVAEWAATGVARALSGGHVAREEAGDYDPSLIRCDRDLASLVDRLARPGAPREPVSFLLSGPPGCGKTEFARFLAARLDMPVLQRKASHFLDKFIGETEKNVARAFEEAMATNSFLLLDEADSLLASRRGAEAWQASFTNELLTWAETHPLPFAATTNRLGSLDDAALRRFTVKAAFDFLSAGQVVAAFRRFFGMEPPSGLDALAALTPADFKLVLRRARLEGFDADPAALAAALSDEQAAKPGQGRGATIGFLRGRGTPGAAAAA
jgi:DNA polymerase III delta prime subunit